MSEVLSFPRPDAMARRGWSQQELAEFYRVEAALVRAGLSIDSEQGLSDEAEPWFVFCRPDGAAIMHFARIGGRYLVASEVLDEPMWGSDFRSLINRVAERHPELLPLRHRGDGTRVTVHPAALLVALVAAAAVSLSSTDARASGWDGTGAGSAPVPPGEAPSAADATGSAEPEARENHRKQFEAIVFSAMIFAAFAAEEAEGRSETEGPAAPDGHPAAQYGASEPGSSAPADGATGAAGSGTMLGTAPAGATPPGSGSAAQTGASGTAQRAEAELTRDAVAQRAPVHGDAHADPEPDGRAPVWSGANAPSRSAASAPSAEAEPEHGAKSSSGAGAVERVGSSSGAAGETASQSQPQERGHPVQDAVSAASVWVSPAALRKPSDAVPEAGEGRGVGKGSDAPAVSGAGPAEAGRAPNHDRDDAPGRPNAHRGEPKGAGEADAAHQDDPAMTPASEHGGKPADPRPTGAAGNDKLDPREQGEPNSNASVQAAPVGQAKGAGADTSHPNDAGSLGKGLDDLGQSAGNGKDRTDPGEHSGSGLDASVQAASTGQATGVGADTTHPNAPGSQGRGLDNPGQSASNGKVDPAEHGGSAPEASGDSAPAAYGSGQGIRAEHAPAAGSPGKAAERPGQSVGDGKDKGDPSEHAGTVADASIEGAPTTHTTGKGVGAEHASTAGMLGKDKADPGQHSESGPDASIDGASVAHGAGKGAGPEHQPATASLGNDSDDPGQSAGHGKDKVDLGDHAGPPSNAPVDAVPGAVSTGRGSDDAGPLAATGRDKVDSGGQGGPKSGTPADVVPAAHAETGAANVSQPIAAEAPGRAKPLAAALDAHGNLVFASDTGHGPGHAPSHAPAEVGMHADVGLIGVPDHAGLPHHFDGHS